MAGWRVGFCLGNPDAIHALTVVKNYYDYGVFTPIQVAAIAALDGPQDCVREAAQTYQRRRDTLVEGLNRIGWPVPRPRASMFVWAPIPEKHRHLGSMKFALKTHGRGRSGGLPPASDSATWGKATFASPWWKTNNASARRFATSKAHCSNSSPVKTHTPYSGYNRCRTLMQGAIQMAKPACGSCSVILRNVWNFPAGCSPSRSRSPSPPQPGPMPCSGRASTSSP